MTMLQWALLLGGVLMSAAGGFFLKVGAVQIQYDEGVINILSQVASNWSIILGVMMYFFPVMIWIFLLKKIEISFLQPLFSLTYVITPMLAMVFLNENVTSVKMDRHRCDYSGCHSCGTKLSENGAVIVKKVELYTRCG